MNDGVSRRRGKRFKIPSEANSATKIPKQRFKFQKEARISVFMLIL